MLLRKKGLPRRRQRPPPPVRPASRPPDASAGSAWGRSCGSAVKTFRTPDIRKRNELKGQAPVLVELQINQLSTQCGSPHDA